MDLIGLVIFVYARSQWSLIHDFNKGWKIQDCSWSYYSEFQPRMQISRTRMIFSFKRSILQKALFATIEYGYKIRRAAIEEEYQDKCDEHV